MEQKRMYVAGVYTGAARPVPRRRRRRLPAALALAALLVAGAVLALAAIRLLSAQTEGSSPVPGGASTAGLPAGDTGPAGKPSPAAAGGPPYVVALDAGHGGSDVGATGLIDEITLTETTVEKLYALLDADPEFAPVLTRVRGEGKTNTERVQAAVDAGAALLLSVHGNSDVYDSTGGFECFPIPPGRAHHADSLRFAGLLAGAMGKAGAGLRGEGGVRYLYFGFDDGRVIHEVSDDTVYAMETFGLLEKDRLPTVLAEQCFITCAEDVRLFAGDEGCTRAAEAYYRAIRSYFGL